MKLKKDIKNFARKCEKRSEREFSAQILAKFTFPTL
jgi:hypothetical protein